MTMNEKAIRAEIQKAEEKYQIELGKMKEEIRAIQKRMKRLTQSKNLAKKGKMQKIKTLKRRHREELEKKIIDEATLVSAPDGWCFSTAWGGKYHLYNNEPTHTHERYSLNMMLCYGKPAFKFMPDNVAKKVVLDIHVCKNCLKRMQKGMTDK